MKESSAPEFIIGTESGILHRLEKENPHKMFFPVGDLCCDDMKKITLEKVHDALKENKVEVEVDVEVARKAKKAIEAMLEIK